MHERRDIDAKYKWDLTKMYATREAFDAEFKLLESKIRDYKKHEKTVTKSAEGLYNALVDMFAIEDLIDRLWKYASLSFSVDNNDNAAQALTGKVRNVAVSAGAASWFVTPYILKLEDGVIEKWIGEYPALSRFSRFLTKTLAMKPHTLSDECEKLMSGLEDAFGSHGDIRGIFANADMRFGKIKNEDGKSVELTDATYGIYLRSSDRRVRRAAFNMMYKTYGQFVNTFATIYNGRVKEETTLAKARGYKDSITASTFRDEVTPEIYYNLIKTVESELEPLYDYYALKCEVLGVDKLHLYDIYAPLVSSLARTYPYDEAVEEVLDTCKIYGKEYYENLKAGLTERGWVDVYPTKGKRGGAFSAGAYLTYMQSTS